MPKPGHRLGPAQRYTDTLGRTVFRAACECMPEGSWWYGPRLPHVYAKHQAHLDALKAKSRAAHPSSRRP